MAPLDQGSNSKQPQVDTSPKVSDEIRKTTCYMCACRCGINVHLRTDEKSGRQDVAYIEGNRDHPINRGVLCAKGSAGIMQHYAPARLSQPLLRVGKRGENKFKPISWDEAFETAVSWLKPVRETAPERLAFFTGRDQSQSLTSWWAQNFGTPNYAAHGGFCSVNMAAAGIYTLGGAFWEFGSPDWERAKYFMIFGVAEDHDSNPIKLGLSRLKERGAKVVAVNPVRTGYNAIADQWVGITPGTDGLFILALVHELIKTGKVDLGYLIRYTNAPWLVYDQSARDKAGLFVCDDRGDALVATRDGQLISHKEPKHKLALSGQFDTPDGFKARPVFELMADLYGQAEYAPETVAKACGISAEDIRNIAQEMARVAFEEEIVVEQPWTDWKGQKHERMIGRPVAMHAMRGISAHSNGFQTCRSIHLLQLLLGSVETPGGFRFKPPYPKPVSAHPKPHGKVTVGKPLDGPHLGYIRGPEDLLLQDDGKAIRIDKAYSWDAPFAAHGLMHMVISNAYAGDPYPVDVLFMYMANMSWNSSMNTAEVMKMLTDKRDDGEYVIPKIIYADAYKSEMVAYADLILPDTTYLERHDCISLLDRPISETEALADSIRWPVVEPDRDVRGFQSALIQLGAKLGLPGMTNEDGSPTYKDYADYIVNHQRRPGVGPLAGFRNKDGSGKGRGEPNPNQIQAYIDNGGFWTNHIPEEALYFKPFNKAYQDWAVERGLFDAPQPYVFQLYLEPMAKFQLAAQGHGDQVPPEAVKQRIQDCFTPLPTWYKPFEQDQVSEEEFPFHAITQRPAAMYHSWGSMNAWLRQIHGHNPLYVSADICDAKDLETGDWVFVRSHHAQIKAPVVRMEALNPNTVWTWNAIGKRKGAWGLNEEAPESKRGFLLNHLIHELLPPKGDGLRWANSDPITGQAAWYDLRVDIEKAAGSDEPAPQASEPQFPSLSDGKASPKQVAHGEKWT